MKSKKSQYSPLSKVLTVFFVFLCLAWVIPIFEVLINSFKENSAVNLNPFALPNSESFVGFANYIKGMTFGNYPFLKSVSYSLFITVVSVALILLFCSMSAWYIARVNSLGSRIFYYLCLFSMIVPFQMVMFTLT
ncbi:MAG TPA: carbohydrate ABC transporter permease, partial [Clostridiales bacterium]|nr:carbohydrate ABC transporter permease [Clostridiales bacterium]